MKKIIFKKVKGWDASHWLKCTVILALIGGKSLFMWTLAYYKRKTTKHEMIADRILRKR